MELVTKFCTTGSVANKKINTINSVIQEMIGVMVLEQVAVKYMVSMVVLFDKYCIKDVKYKMQLLQELNEDQLIF